MKLFIHILIVAAIITAGISPACAFISGKNYIEICNADGQVKKIALPADKNPLANLDTSSSNHSSDHKLKDDCGFCFASSHSKALKNVVLVLEKPQFNRFINVGSGTFILKGQSNYGFLARAPPLSS